MIRCIAIDDEPLALELIQAFIHKVPYLKDIGAFSSTVEALSVLDSGEVDLIFLDINMPDINGLDFIGSLRNKPAFILATAYNEYALQAYEYDAVDYLLKPYSFDRFLRASEKARELITLRQQKGGASGDREDFILVKVEHYIRKILLKDIVYIEGYKEYVKIHIGQKEPILTIKSMKSLEDVLPEGQFMRIHRSYIIAIDKIDTYRRNKVKLTDQFLPIGDAYKEEFQKRILDGRL